LSIESVLYDRLSGYSGLTALVSTRIYPNVAPQNVTVPYITFRRVSSVRDSGFGTDLGTVTDRFQFDAFDTTYSGLRSIVEQLRAALQRWTTTGPPVVEGVFMENTQETFDAEPVLLHRAITDFRIHYQE
jgi:hypothetical protein